MVTSLLSSHLSSQVGNPLAQLIKHVHILIHTYVAHKTPINIQELLLVSDSNLTQSSSTKSIVSSPSTVTSLLSSTQGLIDRL